MIIVFPDLDTLRLALTSGTIPLELALAPVRAGRETGTGRPWFNVPDPAPRGLQTSLRKLGVKGLRSEPADGTEYTCWLQLLPVVRAATPPQLTAQTPVLFEIPHGDLLATLVGEMLRLGNDRQSFRWMTDADGHATVLLRVIGPPYYTLLRALERDRGQPDVRAYLEAAPRVWVEVGHSQALIEALKAPDGQMLLLRAPTQWTFLADTPFRDVYDILDFTVPGQRIDWDESALPAKLDVPLRLVGGSATDAPELWVVRENAVAQLDAFVRQLDDGQMARFSFAAADREGTPTIILRLRQSRQTAKTAPPEVVLNAQAFRVYRGLNNLFLPVGSALQPPLRRDAVRQLLADDPALVHWLYPDGQGGFVAEVLADEAFRPLEDWVNYLIDREREPLATWIQATQFDFDNYICIEDAPSPPKPPAKAKDKTKGRTPRDSTIESAPGPELAFATQNQPSTVPADEMDPLVASSPSEVQLRLRAVEKQFLEVDGPLDAPERIKLWPDLADLNTRLRQTNDATVCWVNGLWEQEELPDKWLKGWLRAEGKDPQTMVTAAHLDAALAQTAPAPGEVRAVVALLVYAANLNPVPTWLGERQPALQLFLLQHEKLLGVRALWLGWTHLSQLAGSDVLSLARARDRVLERLLTEKGLNGERDLPSFLRYAGQRDSERMRVIRERSLRLYQVAGQWATAREQDLEVNTPYVDLIFAFGLARLGETSEARQLLNKAKEYLTKQHPTDKARLTLLEAFRYRIEQSLNNQLHVGSLPKNLYDAIKQLSAKTDSHDITLYAVERLIARSQILEPQEKLDSYRRYMRHIEDVINELQRLPDEPDNQRLAERIRRLLRDGFNGKQTPEIRMYTLLTGLQLAARIGEPFALELLSQILPTIKAVPATVDQGAFDKQMDLIERGLFLAGHYDRLEIVQQLVAYIQPLLQNRKPNEQIKSVSKLTSVTLRSLRKLGLRDETHQLLGFLKQVVYQGKELSALRAKDPAGWHEVLQAALHLAAGWMYVGNLEAALPVLNEARLYLFATEPGASKERPAGPTYAEVARVYAGVLGQAPVEMAILRIEELFKRMDKLPNTGTTNKMYSLAHLQVIEMVVMTVVQEDFALGPNARRWLDDDEYLVRRRIHRDLKALSERK